LFFRFVFYQTEFNYRASGKTNLVEDLNFRRVGNQTEAFSDAWASGIATTSKGIEVVPPLVET
jgi:hypothetical protein